MHGDAIEVLERRLAEMRVSLNDKVGEIEHLLMSLERALGEATQSVTSYGGLRQTIRTLMASPAEAPKGKK